MWALIEKTSGKIVAVSRLAFDPAHYDEKLAAVHEIPDQDVSHLIVGDPPRLEGTLADLIQYTAEDKMALIDRDTDVTISRALHRFAPRGEESAIHRQQLQAILEKLGMKPTDKFQRLLDVAAKAVSIGREDKQRAGG